MPCSSRNLHYDKNQPQGSKWNLVCALMNKKVSNVRELEELLLSVNPSYRGKWDFNGLREFFEEYYEQEEQYEFFNHTLPAMQHILTKMQHLFPDPLPLMTTGTNQTITLTQAQIYCLLAAGFFCTFPQRNQMTNKYSTTKTQYGSYPSINFQPLFRSQSKPESMTSGERIHSNLGQESKLRCLFNYFSVQASYSPCAKVTFKRIHASQVPDWSASKKKLCSCKTLVKGCLEDAHHKSVHVDFANKYLGGGVIGKGCVQEEILFAIFPELIASRLFTESLADNEAYLFIGPQRYCKYSGYGDNMEYVGPYKDMTPIDKTNTRDRLMVAIDAKDFSEAGFDAEDQYLQQWILREINKAYIGFHAATTHNDTKSKTSSSSSGGGGLQRSESAVYRHTLSTGHWGCGAFRGNKELKALIQLMAASEAGFHHIDYYTFGDAEITSALDALLDELHQASITVGGLFDMVSDLAVQRSIKPISPFEHVSAYVKKWYSDVEE
eukprot:TRINITY_DN24218_c0_g1_i1.p1 TRINITY_DN24218_c0_g1~~TRINITY_DN24218_c0_g1_i1.p1  ORF type:complete len:514 (+),score=43.35 TRINITY_DN24218_c0_g1_i1:59-1543(+)